MKHATLKKIIGSKAENIDQKKWDDYVNADKMCFVIPPTLFIVGVAATIFLFMLGTNNYAYITGAVSLFFLGRYVYKMNGACKASRQ